MDRLTTIYEARTIPEASALKERLTEAGISAVVSSEVAAEMGASDVWGLPRPVRVAVDEQDREAARRIAAEFDRSVAARVIGRLEETEAGEPRAEDPQGKPAIASSPEGADASLRDTWPRCPQCDKPRLMQCPYCGTAGTAFRLADQVEREPSPGQSARLLICPTCDEAMTPQYLQECEWCGHRFGDGVAPPQSAFRTEWSWRLAIAVIALAAILVGLIAYFAWLV